MLGRTSDMPLTKTIKSKTYCFYLFLHMCPNCEVTQCKLNINILFLTKQRPYQLSRGNWMRNIGKKPPSSLIWRVFFSVLSLLLKGCH